MPATESDMRRKVMMCATSRPIASAAAASDAGPSASISSHQQREGATEALGSAPLEGQFAGHLVPAVADLADDAVVRHERVLEHDLVEIVLAGQLDDRAAR